MTADPLESRRAIAFLGGLGLGAGLMYFFDPRQGARRRSLLRDQVNHAWHAQRAVVDKGVRDLGNRTGGSLARMRSAVSLFGEPVSDQVLAERVRAKIGRCVAHPGAIEVSAHDRHVTVGGPIFSHEVEDLLDAVRRVRGVRAVESRLEPHDTAQGVPGLQGQPRHRPRPMLQREKWPPSMRLLATAAGLLTSFQGLRRGGLAGELLAGAGAALLVRSVTNLPARRLVGLQAGRRVIDLHKTITIEAPIERVYEFWTRFDNFPRFMAHVREIHVSQDGRLSHWKVQGPGGVTVSWDAEVTARRPNELFAWKTVPNATVEHAGIIRFERLDGDRTRVDIRMSYNPPAGAIGHAVARLFHKDPKAAMDDDLMRLKSLLEGRGVPRAMQHDEQALARSEMQHGELH